MQLLWQGNWANNTNKDNFVSTFRQALKSGDVGMMEYLGNKPPHISNFSQMEWSCLRTIAYGIHPILMIREEKLLGKAATALEQLFVKHKLDLHKFSKYGYLPIHLACQTNNYMILTIIVKIWQQQSSENALHAPTTDKYWHHTPLIIAIKSNSIDCVALLCQHQCVVKNILKRKSRYPNYNAFEFACYYNNINILKILLSNIIKNGNETELNLLHTQLPTILEIANRGVHNRRLKSLCVELLPAELSQEKLMINVKNVNVPDSV